MYFSRFGIVKKKTKLLIAGIGGVGGYFGGLLAKHYFHSDTVEVYFYCRGEHLKQIKEHGLLLIADGKEERIHPFLATDKANEIGTVDFLICCTKSYHLEVVLNQLKPCIHNQTVILPLLNGVDSNEIIERIYPEIEVWKGCVYIVSRKTAQGCIEKKGKAETLHFGLSNGNHDKLNAFLNLCIEAKLDAHLQANIETTVWEKFVFISSIGSLTTYLNKGIGEILTTPEYRTLLLNLIKESIAVASAKKINLPETLTDSILQRLASLPPETTSSMQVDASSGNPTESKSLTEYIIIEGAKVNVATPTYKLVYAGIRK